MEKPFQKLMQVPDGNGAGASHPAATPRIAEFADAPGAAPSVVLICPDEECMSRLRRSVEAQRATVAKEFASYPTYARLNSVVELDSDAVLVEADSDLEVALDTVEAICARNPLATVIVYSQAGSPDQMMRAMRSGAREFLTGTLDNTAVQEALIRAAARHSHQKKKVSGQAVVFWGAKGGSGATTLATNVALALRADLAEEVALLDLNPRLGDIAMMLGVRPTFTLADALKNSKRLDREFVSTLITAHSSGVSVLAAPDSFDPSVPIESRGVGKLMDLLRSQYPFVIVDAGRDLGEASAALADMASTICVVTQVDIPSIRNAHRLITYIQNAGHSQIELVLNRFDARRNEIDDARLVKTLGLAPKWKIPNDYAAARRSADAGTPLIHEKSAAAAAVRAMARALSGRPALLEKKTKFSLFR